MFRIQFLGTSSGVPTKIRNVSGTALVLPDMKSWVLIDCGEGTQHQLLHSKLALLHLKAIFITHVHGDHCYGIPGLIASAAMSGRTESLTVVAPKEIETFYNIAKESTQLYTPFDVEFIATEKLEDLRIGEVMISACELSHRVPSHAFCFTGKKTVSKLLTDKLDSDGIPRGPLWGKIQNGENVQLKDGRRLKANDYLNSTEVKRKVIIAGDNDTPDLLAIQAVDTDVLVHEATYTEALLLKVGPGPQHSSAKRVATFAQTSDIPNLVLTHFSARFQNQDNTNGINMITREAGAEYQGNLYLAEDLDTYELFDDGEFSKLESS